MEKPERKTYFYTVHGAAFGGRRLKPVVENLEARATAALPITGGKVTAAAGGCGEGKIYSLSSASTELFGFEDPATGERTINAESRVDGLKVLERVFTADRLVARLVLTNSREAEQPSVRLTGTEFVNVRINGKPARIETYTEDFTRCATYSSLDRGCSEIIAGQYFWNGKAPERRRTSGLPRHRAGYVPTSIVKNIAVEGNPFETFGHIIHLPEFGWIHLGELQISEYGRRLTMFRMEGGSEEGFDLSGADTRAHGHEFP